MTTLVGIKAEKGKKGVILASDLSRTHTRWIPGERIAYREQTKSEAQKIYVGNKREIAVSMSGIFDQPYIDFLSSLLKGEIDVKKAIAEGYFPELESLNLKRWGRTVPKEDMNGLLIATRFEGPELYTCYPLGMIEKRVSTSVGSGSKLALDHIDHQGKLIPEGVTIRNCIDLAVSSLDQASRDIYTGGLDIVLITRDGIKEFGDQIKTAVDGAKKNVIKEIKRGI